jgi:1-acyl-sn-glycerol-3-phosphate acyltransferase
MATKGVLGNDPFQRGAAQRPTESQSSPARKGAAKKPARSRAAAKGGKTRKTPAVAADKTVETPAIHGAKTVRTPKVAAKAPKGDKGRKSGRAGGPTPEEAHRLREPAAPVTPRRRPPAKVPVIPEPEASTKPRTKEELEVDQVLATAVAMEATEAAAEAAAEVAVETILTLQAERTGVARPAPGSLDETWNRELATAVVAEAAEAAAEAVLESALASMRSASSAPDDAQDPEERTMVTSAYEDEEATFRDHFDDEVTVVDRAYRPEPYLDGIPEASEEEQPDPELDEFPPGRTTPFSVTPPPPGQEPAQEPFFTEQAPAEQSSPASVGMFSLAKEMALQALSGASVGKALVTAQGLLGAALAGLGAGGSTSLDEYGQDSELVQELKPLLDFLYERYWRVTVQGADAVPTGGAILVANHSGALPFDGLVASQALLRERADLREPRWLVEDQIFHAPVLGTLFNRLGAVRACPENAVRLLDERRPVLVFPEGYQGLSKPFAQRYQLKRFGRGGFVKLALRTGAPIIPVAIVGSEETTPLLGRIPASFLGVPYVPLTSPMPLPARWTLRFGEPMSMEGLGPDAADDLAEVHRLTERTREAIQGMLQALLRERRSVFAG